jgi:hypothetical protein
MSEDNASRIIIDNSIMLLQIVAPLTDDSKSIIYDLNMFIVQAELTKWGIKGRGVPLLASRYKH